MTADLAKQKAIAEIIEGKVVDDSKRVEVCIKGTLLGFPATLEAIRSGFPFGVSYFVETEPDMKSRPPADQVFYISVVPRFATGIISILSRIFLFESRGQSVGDKHFEGRYVFNHNSFELAERFVHYPGVKDRIEDLQKYTGFNELVVRAGYGVYLSQPKSFNQLDLDVCREAFRLLGELGQVVFDAFSPDVRA